MIARIGVAALVLAVVTLALASPASAAQTLPKTGDSFHYTEKIYLTDGQGNYTGYTEEQFLNGSYAVVGIAANGSAEMSYQSTDNYENSLGTQQLSSESGPFEFSPTTLHYDNGSDNQTGYVNPTVWFYIDDALTPGASFYLLNSQLTLVSTDAAFAHSGSSTGYVATLFGEGNGSYQRNDEYGDFTATYNWKAYFDPATGYIVGYVYTEHDVDGTGDGFTWTDTLAITSSSYALTPIAAPPPPPAAAPPYALYAAVVVIVLVLLAVIILVVRRRPRGAQARHSEAGTPSFAPTYAAPPPLNFGGTGQPAVQQIVIKETVKVKCQYCGTLIDSTATVCPKCGAPRT